MRRRRLGWQTSTVLLGVLAVATVLAGGFGVWATISAAALRSAAGTASTALIDPAATASVQRSVSKAVQSVFSYDYTDVGRTRVAAQRVLTGAAVRQYDQLFALVQQQARREKLVLTTKVTADGVELLTGGRARVLVFANQKDTRAGTRQSSFAGTMFAVTAVHRGGRWLIEDIDTFSAAAGTG